MKKVVIIGAGPAGLAAGERLSAQGESPLILEKEMVVGGLSRTLQHHGYRFDIGPHRFYATNAAVLRWWHRLLKEDFHRIPRTTRICYNGKYFHYPLSIPDVLTGLGWGNSALILGSYLKRKFFPLHRADNLERWITNRFGKRLFRIFFKHYSEKVWGLPCERISSDWSQERISGFSLSLAIRNALSGARHSRAKTLIKHFYFPRLGAGMMYEAVAKLIIEKGGQIRLRSEVIQVIHGEGRINALVCKDALSAGQYEIEGSDFCSSMPITQLIAGMDPPVPQEVLEACQKLRFRSLVMVYLIVAESRLFEDNWIYVHSPEVKVARIVNFKNWSPDMVVDSATTSLGMEYFCDEKDEFWSKDDGELADVARSELEKLKLSQGQKIIDWYVLRVPKAYPVYEVGYRRHLEVTKGYLRGFSNLQCVGRYGMFQYDGMEHAVLTGLLAAQSILGVKKDLWSVDMEEPCDV